MTKKTNTPTGVPVGPYADMALPPAFPTFPTESVTPSVAMRASFGTKIDTRLVPYALICYAAAGLNYGAAKYVPRNFENGFPLSSLLMSIERHTRALMNGEIYDDDETGSQLPHIFLLASSIAMLCENDESGTLKHDIIKRSDEEIYRKVSEISSSAKYDEDRAHAHR